jgi:GNAT superfamily N-acetyltransferase
MAPSYSMDDVIVRNADLADAAAIAELSGQLGYPVKEGEVRDRLVAILHREGNRVWVAEVGGKVVGWAHVVGEWFLESPPFAELVGLIVDHDTRGLGIGRHLVEACTQWARGQGFQQIRVRSNVVREEAHRFYLKVGFSKIKSQAVFAMDLPRS